MNIIVTSHVGKVSCRPDTSWERENKDIYTPDFVTEYDYTPVFFARICKAGKCIGEKFVERYYDAVNFGMFLYPRTERDYDSSIMDHSSILPFPMYNNAVMEKGDNRFELICDNEELFSTDIDRFKEMIERAIVAASDCISIRIGDLIAVELTAPMPLPSTKAYIQATFCGNPLFDFHIK